jgi:hypothetical protein
VKREHNPHSRTYGYYQNLVHSVRKFRLPAPIDGASTGLAQARTRIDNVRPLKSVPHGFLVETHTDIIKGDRLIGGGKVNFASIPTRLPF